MAKKSLPFLHPFSVAILYLSIFLLSTPICTCWSLDSIQQLHLDCLTANVDSKWPLNELVKKIVLLKFSTNFSSFICMQLSMLWCNECNLNIAPPRSSVYPFYGSIEWDKYLCHLIQTYLSAKLYLSILINTLYPWHIDI